MPTKKGTTQAGYENYLLIAKLPYALGEAVWLVAVTCIRPEELAFKWSDIKWRSASFGFDVP